MNFLAVGDPHCTVEEIPDCRALMDFVLQTCLDRIITKVVILGDLHHTFSITNIKVTAFWLETFERFTKKGISIMALVGNHDMAGDGTGYPHALLPYMGMNGVTVVDKPLMLGGALFLPYYADPKLFVSEVERFPDVELVVCHQEFNGAQYDNGFYAPGGVDPSLMKVPVMSGHIHTPQTLDGGRVVIEYIGAPRWRTLSDAATQSRKLVYVQNNGQLCESIPVNGHVKRIIARTLTPESCVLVDYNEHDEFRITLEGPAAWIQQEKDAFQHSNIKVSAVATDVSTARVRESDGIEVAFRKFLSAYSPKNGTPKDTLAEMARTRL